MGRKKKPSALEKAQGNPGHRPINLDEPEPPELLAFPPAPDLFKNDKVAREEWNTLGPILFAMGIITPCDLTAFMGYCKNRSRWLEAEGDVNKHGVLVTEISKDGTERLKKNPAITAALAYQTNMIRLMTEFGLTPSSRVRLIGKNSPDGGDDLDEIETKANELAPKS